MPEVSELPRRVHGRGRSEVPGGKGWSSIKAVDVGLSRLNFGPGASQIILLSLDLLRASSYSRRAGGGTAGKAGAMDAGEAPMASIVSLTWDSSSLPMKASTTFAFSMVSGR